MIKQTVPGFKTERTEERLTSHSGLVPYCEFMKAIGVEEAANRHMPKPGANKKRFKKDSRKKYTQPSDG